MDIYLKKMGSSLHPAYDSDVEAVSGLSMGEVYKCKVTKPRNPLFHRKFFALLNLAFNNQDQYDNFEKFRFVMMMKAGFFEVIKTDKGVVYMPKSISFAKMDQEEFEKVYEVMVNEVQELIEIDNETISEELKHFM